MPGDGIGVEVIEEAVRVLRTSADAHDIALELVEWDLGAERYLRDGVTITEAEFRELEDAYDALLLGALGDPRIEDGVHAREILLGLRFRLDLYVNYRPCLSPHPPLSPLRDPGPEGYRVEIFRENTEGPYVNVGGSVRKGTPDEVAIQEDVNTRMGVERILSAAFEHARGRGPGKVTMVDKANALPHAGRLWRRTFEEVGASFPDVERETLHVDVAAMDLVRRPGELGVLVTSNLFGDILSDLAAELAGGLGLAPSANLHPGRHALFEPVHGSAPDIAGRGTANPLAAIRCAALLLEHFGHGRAADGIERAVREAVRAGFVTPDLGGQRDTAEVGARIAGAVAEKP